MNPLDVIPTYRFDIFGSVCDGGISNNPEGVTVVSDSVLILEFAKAQERRGNMPRSIRKRTEILRCLSRSLEGRGLLATERNDVEDYLDSRPIGPKTRAIYLSHIRCFFVWAIEEEMLENDPTAKIRRPKTRRSLPRPASTKELEIAIRGATPRHRCWVALAAYAGLRCQEIAGLRSEDLIEADGLLRVVHAKGGHERMLPLHPEVVNALRTLPIPRTGWMFVTASGAKFTPEYLSIDFNRFLRASGVNATAHQIRHWFATELYRSTHDIRLVQEMLGHASPSTTAIYTAFAPEDAAKGIGGLSLTG